MPSPLPGPSFDRPAPQLEQAAPPSTYAVEAVLEGHSGAALRLLGLTALRSFFILPGLWAASRVVNVKLDGVQLLVFSLASSMTISAGMVLWYASRKCGLVK
jgi:hypothetical protein